LEPVKLANPAIRLTSQQVDALKSIVGAENVKGDDYSRVVSILMAKHTKNSMELRDGINP
jgi:hypothetical protein